MIVTSKPQGFEAAGVYLTNEALRRGEEVEGFEWRDWPVVGGGK